MADKKEIKFAFVVDERSAARATQVLNELISKAQVLAQTLQGVGGGGIGAPGGGQGILGQIVTGNVGAARSPGAMRAAIQTPKPGAGPKGLVDIFAGAGESLKSMANISKDSMRIMSDGIRRAVDDQKRALGELDSQLANLARRYDDLAREKTAAISAGADPADRRFYENMEAGLHEEHVDLLKRRQKASKSVGDLEAQLGDLEPEGGGTGGKSALRRMFERKVQGALSGLVGPELAGMAGSMAVPLGMAAIGGRAIAGTAWGSYWNQPMSFEQDIAQRGSLWGGMALGQKYGDRRQTDVMMQIMNDPDKLQDFNKIAGQTLGARWQNFQFKDLFTDLNALMNSQSDMAIQHTIGKRMVEFQQNERESNPLRNDLYNTLQSSSASRNALMRQAGIGEYLDKKTNKYVTAFDDALQPLRHLYSDAEMVGMMTSVAGAGTRAAGHRYFGSALNAQGAGIQGAAQLYGLMSGMGGERAVYAPEVVADPEKGIYSRTMKQVGIRGAADDFMDQLLTQTGDPTALNRIGMAAAQMVQAGGAGGRGAGLGMLDLLGTGLTGGMGDALTAEQNLRGIGALGRQQQGTLDSFQSAINTELAFKEFGADKGMYAAQYAATGMSMDEIADLRKGRLSEGMRAIGFTDKDIDRLKDLAGQKSATALLRAVPSGFGAGTAAGDATAGLRAAQAAGISPQKWFEGIKDKKEQERMLSGLAMDFQVTGMAEDFGAGKGMAREMLGLFAPAGARGKRRGAARGEIETDQGKMDADRAKEYTEFLKTSYDELKTQAATKTAIYKAETDMMQILTKSGKEAAQALQAIVRAGQDVASGKIRPDQMGSQIEKYKSDAMAKERNEEEHVQVEKDRAVDRTMRKLR